MICKPSIDAQMVASSNFHFKIDLDTVFKHSIFLAAGYLHKELCVQIFDFQAEYLRVTPFILAKLVHTYVSSICM